jgi:2-polyprenyl-3-methyl-5-hydroxy-6-metoxy-1,4-benzoquinol methylase
MEAAEDFFHMIKPANCILFLRRRRTNEGITSIFQTEIRCGIVEEDSGQFDVEATLELIEHGTDRFVIVIKGEGRYP